MYRGKNRCSFTPSLVTRQPLISEVTHHAGLTEFFGRHDLAEHRRSVLLPTHGLCPFSTIRSYFSQVVKQLDPVFANVVDSQAHIAAPLVHASVHGRSRMPSLLTCLSQRIHQDVRKPSNETN